MKDQLLDLHERKDSLSKDDLLLYTKLYEAEEEKILDRASVHLVTLGNSRDRRLQFEYDVLLLDESTQIIEVNYHKIKLSFNILTRQTKPC